MFRGRDAFLPFGDTRAGRRRSERVFAQYGNAPFRKRKLEYKKENLVDGPETSLGRVHNPHNRERPT